MCTVIKMTTRTIPRKKSRRRRGKKASRWSRRRRRLFCLSIFGQQDCLLSCLARFYPFAMFFSPFSEAVCTAGSCAEPLSVFVEPKRNAFAIITTKSRKRYTFAAVPSGNNIPRIVGYFVLLSWSSPPTSPFLLVLLFLHFKVYHSFLRCFFLRKNNEQLCWVGLVFSQMNRPANLRMLRACRVISAV